MWGSPSTYDYNSTLERRYRIFTEQHMPRDWCCVYVLMDRGAPFYVGQTVRIPHKRFCSHLVDLRRKITCDALLTPCQTRLAMIIDEGRNPEFQVVDYQGINDATEQVWIKACLEEGLDLANVAHTGARKQRGKGGEWRHVITRISRLADDASMQAREFDFSSILKQAPA